MRVKTHSLTATYGLLLLLSLPTAWAAELGKGEWYVRLIATSDTLRDQGNVLGQLKDSKRGYDIHDLKELSPFATPYLTIVFPHPNWGENAGDYASDFHNIRRRWDRWVFEVRSDDPNREVTLSWNGQANMKRMKLIDVATRTRVKAIKKGKIQTYTFNMNGQTTRTFKWVGRNVQQRKKRARDH